MAENPQQPRRPGAWPVERPVELDALKRANAEQKAEQEHGEQYARLRAAAAWNQLVLDNIRIDLSKQPSPAAVRAAARRWNTAITQLADNIIKELQ